MKKNLSLQLSVLFMCCCCGRKWFDLQISLMPSLWHRFRIIFFSRMLQVAVSWGKQMTDVWGKSGKECL